MAAEDSDVLIHYGRSTGAGLLLQLLRLLDNYPPSMHRPLGHLPPLSALFLCRRRLSVRCPRLGCSVAIGGVQRWTYQDGDIAVWTLRSQPRVVRRRIIYLLRGFSRRPAGDHDVHIRSRDGAATSKSQAHDESTCNRCCRRCVLCRVETVGGTPTVVVFRGRFDVVTDHLSAFNIVVGIVVDAK